MANKKPWPERLLSKISPPNESGCWLWAGSMGSNGYGVIYIDGRNVGAHRAVWEHYKSPIPKGYHIDHLCRVPTCVNPDHLEPVTPGENNRRGETFAKRNLAATHCPLGHELAGDNLDRWSLENGHRACKECMRRRCREWHARNREARLEKMKSWKQKTGYKSYSPKPKPPVLNSRPGGGK